MKRFLCAALSLLLLLSLAGCGGASDEELAFQEACKLLEEGKYQEAYTALTTLESYRTIQEKIDEAAAGIEAQRLAEEEAARQALLEKIGFLYGTTWHEINSTIELTFGECQDDGTGACFVGSAHYLEWMEPTMKREADYDWYLIGEELFISYLPGLSDEYETDKGYPITTEDRDGVTHLLIGNMDFVRTEDYNPN